MKLRKFSSGPTLQNFVFLGNLKITQKLAGLLLALMVGFIVIGIAYYMVLASQKNAVAVSNKMTQFENGIHEVQVDLLNARRSETEFYLKKYPIFLGNFDTRIVVASQNLKELTTLVKDEDELKVVSKLGQAFENYRAKFISSAETQVEIGLDENTGLNQQMVKTSDALYKMVSKSGSSDMVRSLNRALQFQSLYAAREEDKYAQEAAKELDQLQSQITRSAMTEQVKTDATKALDDYFTLFNKHVQLMAVLKQQKNDVKQAVKAIEPLFEDLLQISSNIIARTRDEAVQQQDSITYFFIVTLLVISLLVSVALFLFARGITVPLKQLQDTVVKVNEGDISARTNLHRTDELGELAQAFDKLLDEKVASLARAEEESERLNESVIQLIKSVSELAQGKNLAVKVPVSEDITGAIGDSLNYLAKETAKILGEVRDTSHQVAEISSIVKKQSDHVIAVASAERMEVEATANMLRESVDAMNAIAEDAQHASKQADKTSLHTQQALDAVITSVEGINSIRSTISETEKRIKRLGERSQEITGIVNLINSIAERTHILALNASMHAASAGEAGRGFAVVADEVQRLAENARQATSEISTLVNNIRIETADTVATMNTVISRVAEETRLAEQARRNMKDTQAATSELVGFVQHIANSSMSHADISKQLLGRARQIQDSTEQTGRELLEQTRNTESLVKCSEDLVATVGVFKLPGDAGVEPRKDIDFEIDQAEEITARLRVAS
jgi:twitching motility protein PilJ